MLALVTITSSPLSKYVDKQFFHIITNIKLVKKNFCIYLNFLIDFYFNCFFHLKFECHQLVQCTFNEENKRYLTMFCVL